MKFCSLATPPGLLVVEARHPERVEILGILATFLGSLPEVPGDDETVCEESSADGGMCGAETSESESSASWHSYWFSAAFSVHETLSSKPRDGAWERR